MKKSEIIKILLRSYIEGKLTDTEQEQLFYLINREELRDTVFSEQYKRWHESSGSKDLIWSEEVLKRIRSALDITDEKLNKDDLVLKGHKYEQLQSNKSILSSVLKYAAVALIAVLSSGLVYYLSKSVKSKQIEQNEIFVPYGARIKLTLADSSEVWINSGSTLSYPSRFAESKREVYLNGEAFFMIRQKPRKPFYVKTSGIGIKVLGTRFNVKAYPEEDHIETTLISGKIMIETKNGDAAEIKETLLLPNQKACYSKKTKKLMLEDSRSLPAVSERSKRAYKLGSNQNTKKTHQVDIETAWKHDQLIFRNERLSTLEKKLERWYDVSITINDSLIGEYKFTGTIEHETIEQVMKAFSVAADIDYSMNQNRIDITRRERKSSSGRNQED